MSQSGNHNGLAAAPALECTAVEKRFGSTTALAGATLRCHGGAVTALLGHNGAGKSTLFRAAVGLLVPDAGEVTVRGHRAGTPAAGRATSFMPEQPDLYPGLSVWEHTAFIGLAYRLTGWQRRAHELLERFGLAERRDALPNQLSQGLRRRLGLVMALLHGADVLLLDEPFNGLDPRSAGQLRRMVTDLAAAGVCVVVATHILADVTRLADRSVLLERGTVVASGTLGELRDQAGLPADADLETVYLALTDLSAEELAADVDNDTVDGDREGTGGKPAAANDV